MQNVVKYFTAHKVTCISTDMSTLQTNCWLPSAVFRKVKFCSTVPYAKALLIDIDYSGMMRLSECAGLKEKYSIKKWGHFPERQCYDFLFVFLPKWGSTPKERIYFLGKKIFI